MFFQQEFYLVWASLELFMAMTHLFVFLGFRNSKLGFIRRQQNYFLLDGFTHFVNILINIRGGASYPVLSLWAYAFVVHLYYYHNLVSNPPPKRKQDGQMEEDNSNRISRIFHWSCVEFSADRFSIFQSGKEMLETTLDVTAHSIGFLLAFQRVHSFWYKLAALLLMLGLFKRQMLSLKYFLTDPKMMPVQLRRFFSDYAAPTAAN